ncbi:MAG: hypothetical protein H6710_00135 [Myxococcales bacterium]|nr:hypothetical protein [Myxococcales bacterium]
MRRSTLPLALLLLTACSPLAVAGFGDYEIATDSEADGSTSEPGGSPLPGSPNATSDDATTSTATTGEPESTGTSGSPPAGPPSIIDVEISPKPILHNGPITIEVDAEDADGVRLELESGELIELVDAGPGIFVGELAARTGLDNGEHPVTLTPWREDQEGEPVEATYTISLPKAGSEGLWETGDLIGAGFVSALGLLPGGDLIELGTVYINDDPHCYLRRRDKSGAWWDADVVPVLGDQTCTAMDLKVADDGTIYLLLLRHDNGVARWWLGKLPAWGDATKNLRIGNPGEEAVALALDGEKVAVCGSVPTEFIDGKDAAVWIYTPDLPGPPKIFDYQVGMYGHWSGETVRDCIFAGDELVLVGDALGKHEGQLEKARNRHFILRYNQLTQEERWLVASIGLGAQSGATAVAVDDQGQVLTAGYRCADDCDPMGMLQIHDADGLVWHADIGAWPNKGYAARDLVWSPAGYAVLASGGSQGSEDAFMVRAYAPGEQVAPLWTYTRADADLVHLAQTLVIGTFGEIWAAGFGASGYPAVAQIAG